MPSRWTSRVTVEENFTPLSKLASSVSFSAAIGLLDRPLPALSTQGQRATNEKHRREERERTADGQLLLRDRQKAFRPCVLISENVPAETL
jgi:hypothetical protein